MRFPYELFKVTKGNLVVYSKVQRHWGHPEMDYELEKLLDQHSQLPVEVRAELTAAYIVHKDHFGFFDSCPAINTVD